VACGVHAVGFVNASIRAHWGRAGIILKAFGRGPDLYRDKISPTLPRSQIRWIVIIYMMRTDLLYTSTTFGLRPSAGSGTARSKWSKLGPGLFFLSNNGYLAVPAVAGYLLVRQFFLGFYQPKFVCRPHGKVIRCPRFSSRLHLFAIEIKSSILYVGCVYDDLPVQHTLPRQRSRQE
jgi:hypothetical protein